MITKEKKIVTKRNRKKAINKLVVLYNHRIVDVKQDRKRKTCH
jgi:hypothetical protein